MPAPAPRADADTGATLRAALDETGVGLLPGVVGRAEADAMADAVWASLARRGVERGDRRTWPVGYVSGHRALRQAGAFDGFGTPGLAAAIRAAVPAGDWVPARAWGPALVTFPEPGPWAVPHSVWHLDLPGRGDPDWPGVLRLFGFVGDVGPGGGGTLVVEGSHELVRRMVAAAPGHDAGRSSDVRRRLAASHPWFRALAREGGGDRVRRFMTEGEEIAGVHVRVAELTGAAGDVAVMLPWTVHSLGMNTAAAPRFMVTQSLHRR
jgi:hypothetical protein